MIHCYQLTHWQQCMSKGEAEGEIPPAAWVTVPPTSVGLRAAVVVVVVVDGKLLSFP